MKRNLINLITKYFYFGIISACIEIIFFFLLIKYLNYIFANTVSYCLGILTSFVLNRIYNFKIKDKAIKRFSRFFFVNIVGLIISNFFLLIFNGMIPYFELKILSMPFIMSLQFLLNYFWTFKKI